MKRIILFLFLTNTCFSWSQEDAFKFNFDITFGSVIYYYDEIENNGYYFSSDAWFDTIHSQSSEHVYYKYAGLNTMLHVGLHIPVYKNKIISFGLKPKVGLGRLIQLSPNPNKIVDEYGWEVENDPKRISSGSFDAQLYGYFQYNLEENLLTIAHVSLFGGYRIMKSHDNYSTPVVGLEYGQEQWSLALYSHLTRMNYYRQFSDGTTELAKRFHEFGLSLNWYIKPKVSSDKTETSKKEML